MLETHRLETVRHGYDWVSFADIGELLAVLQRAPIPRPPARWLLKLGLGCGEQGQSITQSHMFSSSHTCFFLQKWGEAKQVVEFEWGGTSKA